MFDFTIKDFSEGILLYTILISGIIMAIALIKNKGGKVISKDLLKNIVDLEPSLEEHQTEPSTSEKEEEKIIDLYE